MTEEARSFHQDNITRSIISRSAHHKNCAPSDVKLGNKPMSWQEIRSKHGKEETFPSTDCLISYSDFIRYSPDLKVEYVNKTMDKYDINLQHISRYLFNKGDDGLKSYLRNNKLLNLCNYKKARSKSGLLQFQADIEEWKRREDASKEIDEAEAQRKRNIIWNAEFIDYEELKALPVDGQVAYVNNLIKKYSISLTPIARYLFKIDQGSLRDHFKSLKVYDQIEKSKSGNGKTGKIRIATFVDAVKNWRGESTLEETTKSESIGEQPDIPTEETLDKQIKDLNKKLASDPVVNVDDFLKQDDIPKLNQINLEFTPLKAEETPKPSSEVYFSTRYISEKGLDREAIMNKIYLLATLFENEENLEITLTIATKKEELGSQK